MRQQVELQEQSRRGNAACATVNGLVLGGDAAVADYYRREVAGGPGAFVLSVADALGLGEAMRRKLAMDLMASLAAP